MLDGLTDIDAPMLTAVPPQLPLYQCQLAPVPSEPPFTLKVALPPLQIVVAPFTEVAAVELLFTVTVVPALAVPQHPVPD